MGGKGTSFAGYIIVCVPYPESVIRFALTIKLPVLVKLCANNHFKRY